jgi:hypothetical protein
MSRDDGDAKAFPPVSPVCRTGRAFCGDVDLVFQDDQVVAAALRAAG